MPNITAAGTYDSSMHDWKFLGTAMNEEITLLFAGNSVGTSTDIRYLDDQGVERLVEGGIISSLPRSLVIGPLSKPIRIVCSGTPDLNVTYGGQRRD